MSFGHLRADQDCSQPPLPMCGQVGPFVASTFASASSICESTVGHTSYTLEPANVRTHYHLW